MVKVLFGILYHIVLCFIKVRQLCPCIAMDKVGIRIEYVLVSVC